MSTRMRVSFVKVEQHYKVPIGYRIRRTSTGWDVMDSNYTTIRHFAAKLALLADVNPNWVSFSDLSPTPLPAVSRFASSWKVPPLPTDSSLSIFFFNGLEEMSGQNILQPVLQWGPTVHGGIPGTWSIASWYVGSAGSPAFSSEAIPVVPGTQLTGVIEFNGTNWSCYFEGFPGTTLLVDTLPDMQVASLTLESYTATQGVPSDLTLSGPPVSFQVTALATISGKSLAGFQWAPYGQWTPSIQSSAPQSGRVTVAYR
jgi:hypothetical protein